MRSCFGKNVQGENGDTSIHTPRSAVEFIICVKLFSTVVLFHFLQSKVNDNYY